MAKFFFLDHSSFPTEKSAQNPFLDELFISLRAFFTIMISLKCKVLGEPYHFTYNLLFLRTCQGAKKTYRTFFLLSQAIFDWK